MFDNPDYLNTVPVAEKMTAAISKGITRPMYVRWAEMQSDITQNLQKVIVGEWTVEEALQQCQIDCERILNED